MLRIGISSVVSFILFYIESLIVMQLKGASTIEIGGMAPFINIWAMNFFFVFAILTQVGNWFQTRGLFEQTDEHNIY
ncbi:hypothetical protein [Bacillus sp. EB600]|uniref:hypothetical protein n=1 Tax=Bacillus sp. EB600 TaxID=2806345 RepID=UPI00210A806A|nr:hypothetical protein [Bacillus sp. EB600]MCQ6281154.1 hypothetical protein [Bacillus sp. EB600]